MEMWHWIQWTRITLGYTTWLIVEWDTLWCILYMPWLVAMNSCPLQYCNIWAQWCSFRANCLSNESCVSLLLPLPSVGILRDQLQSCVYDQVQSHYASPWSTSSSTNYTTMADRVSTARILLQSGDQLMTPQQFGFRAILAVTKVGHDGKREWEQASTTWQTSHVQFCGRWYSSGLVVIVCGYDFVERTKCSKKEAKQEPCGGFWMRHFAPPPMYIELQYQNFEEPHQLNDV